MPDLDYKSILLSYHKSIVEKFSELDKLTMEIAKDNWEANKHKILYHYCDILESIDDSIYSLKE